VHKIKDRKRKQSTPDKKENFKQKEAKPRPFEEEGKNELIFVILQKRTLYHWRAIPSRTLSNITKQMLRP